MIDTPDPPFRRALDAARDPRTARNALGIVANVLQVTGTPEGAVAAPVGTMAVRTDGGAGTTLYIKETGTGKTGWVAK